MRRRAPRLPAAREARRMALSRGATGFGDGGNPDCGPAVPAGAVAGQGACSLGCRSDHDEESKAVLTITPLYAGALAIWFLALSYRVVQRRGHGISLGDGGDTLLLRRIRGHANFAEYVPLILLMMAMLEFGGATPAWLLHLLGATLLVARLLHGYALSFSEHFKFGRFWGTLLTFVLLLVCGALCLWRGVIALAI